MFESVLRKIFGSANDRIIKKYAKKVQEISALEEKYAALSDLDLQNQTFLFKQELEKGKSLDDILPDAFAVVREASKRVLGMRPFDVQMIGGMVLHEGMISEMKTGEGKTLVATLPVYLNALTGKGVHVITVNDYLAKRDSDWMGQLYRFLGLSVGCIVHGLTDKDRKKSYESDITYGTNHEFGFDYLRDNMKFRLGEMVQRPFNFSIVDEVDSILIDEARTPLIISGAAEDSSELYDKVDKVIPRLVPEDFEKDEKNRSVTLTDAGVEHVEQLLRQTGLMKGQSLYDIQNISLVHHVNQALKAHKSFARDVDYIVKDGKVIIIDEFTGRMMDGRRYSEGLHQALEAKEGVEIEMENQTLASITYQNFFRLYPKLAGMTGTAMTESAEFEEIYKLRVVEVPTNIPVSRLDHEDEVYMTSREKYEAMLKLIQECKERQQPVLVGTTSIEKSELISEMLTKLKITHQVLNARYHEKEAEIIAEAGCLGAVTIATNMAGRGTDIKLGGNLDARIKRELKGDETDTEREQIIARIKAEIEVNQEKVKQAGGLYVIGTERHESRRVDNQLRGRSGRQGDPGASKFFISLQDDLMRIFGSERLDSMLRRLGVKEGEVISHSWITKALERAQQKVEARNFDVRKHLLRYDDVMNDQRKIIYEQRLDLMKSEDISETIKEIRQEVIRDLVHRKIPEQALIEAWDLKGLHEECLRLFGIDFPIEKWAQEEGIAEIEIFNRIYAAIEKTVHDKEEKHGYEVMRMAEKNVLLRILDQNWKDHLLSLDHLRQGINWRAYAQSNPLNEYKREAFNLFEGMLSVVKEQTVSMLVRMEIDGSNNNDEDQDPRQLLQNLLEAGVDFDKLKEIQPELSALLTEAADQELPENVKRFPAGRKPKPANAKAGGDKEGVSRNALCPCGSGKRYKHCHGASGK